MCPEGGKCDFIVFNFSLLWCRIKYGINNGVKILLAFCENIPFVIYGAEDAVTSVVEPESEKVVETDEFFTRMACSEVSIISCIFSVILTSSCDKVLSNSNRESEVVSDRVPELGTGEFDTFPSLWLCYSTTTN